MPNNYGLPRRCCFPAAATLFPDGRFPLLWMEVNHEIHKFVVYREDKYYVSQCLNIDVASCGDTIGEAIQNLKAATELYFEKRAAEYHPIEKAVLGEYAVNG
mgnify:CR=1 FL=1